MNPLGATLTSYLTSKESYVPQPGPNLNRVATSLKSATLSEILNLYNTLIFNQSWTSQLNDLFQTELRNRILDEATFSLLTVWRSINEWKQRPYVCIQLGFDESYLILDADGEAILEDDPGASSCIITNESLEEKDQRKILELLLQITPEVKVRLYENRVVITSVDKLSLLSQKSEGKFTEQQLILRVYHTPDFHLVYMMLQSLQKNIYDIINIQSDLNEELELIPLPPPEEFSKKPSFKELWDKIHLTALKSNTVEKINQYTIWIWQVCRNLPCSECKWHMLHYLNLNPVGDCIVPEEFRAYTAFYWSWQFHNEVNIRTGKNEYKFKEALEYYLKLR